ncbi:MAG TPA: Spy/CpxP family protein refolding chaperone [Burkholderiales bacterium]|nr:Spy/CpxP family protein refolding chaperone [Burkholderiales bacterium]
MNRTKRFTLAALFGGLLAGIGSKAFAHGGRHGFGAGPIDPAEMNERIERFVKHLAVEARATPDQQEKLAVIAKDAAKELAPLREQAREARRQAIELFSAPNVDRAAIEKLRATQIRLADGASRRLTQALADAAEVLTPEQRKTLAERAARHRRGWHRG